MWVYCVPQTTKGGRDRHVRILVTGHAGYIGTVIVPMLVDAGHDVVGLDSTVRLAELAKKAGVPRFVFSSSCSNYGAAGDSFLTEEADLNPLTSYAASKVRVEADVARLAVF
jgi:nucleoside-diphosphate-sugar epimerase